MTLGVLASAAMVRTCQNQTALASDDQTDAGQTIVARAEMAAVHVLLELGLFRLCFHRQRAPLKGEVRKKKQPRWARGQTFNETSNSGTNFTTAEHDPAPSDPFGISTSNG